MLAVERAPLGPIELFGERGGKALTAVLPVGKWDVAFKPAALAAALYEVDQAIAKKEFSRAAYRIELLARRQSASLSPKLLCWLYVRAAEARANAHQAPQARVDYGRARRLATEPMQKIALFTSLGDFYKRFEKFDKAEDAYREICTAARSLGEDNLALGRCWLAIGNLLYAKKDVEHAQEYWQNALNLRMRKAPESLEVAGSLTNLGDFYLEKDDFDGAEKYYLQAYAIQERLAPVSSDSAASMIDLGLIAEHRGDLLKEIDWLSRAFDIQTTVHPESPDVAGILNDLANVLMYRGDLAAAESKFRRAVDLANAWAPESLDVAGYSIGLANVFMRQQEYDAAEKALMRAERIQRRKLRGVLRYDLAETYDGLGNIAAVRGSRQLARRLYLKALKLTRSTRPTNVAFIYNDLGDLSLGEGDVRRAADSYRKAIAAFPFSPAAVSGWVGLGRAAATRGDLEHARSSYLEALGIAHRLFPDSLSEAEILGELGIVERSAGRVEQAIDYLHGCVTILGKVVGLTAYSHDIQSRVRSPFMRFYRALVEALVAEKKDAAAFEVLEASRASALLALLAERDISFTKDVEPEVERAQRRLRLRYEELEGQLRSLEARKPGDSAGISRLAIDLGAVRTEVDESAAALRTASPRLADLKYPRPLDLTGVASSLDADTVLLSFCVGEKMTIAFAVSRSGLERTAVLDVPRSVLERAIDDFGDTLGDGERWSTDDLTEQGRRIFDILLAPFNEVISRSARVVIVPDGCLNKVSWPALVRTLHNDDSSSRKWEYLIEWKAIDVVQSATVLSELAKQRRIEGVNDVAKPGRFVGFGNPAYGGQLKLRALTFSQREVERIAKLFEGNSETYLGRTATEERAKAIGANAKYLHFATHTLLSGRFPLNSAVVLAASRKTTGEQDDGLLQAWEVLEDVRLEADLVVLSGCESAVGEEVEGEGLIGLVRAFEYAGAQSVVASLWQVADATTAELMIQFYQKMLAGKDKAEALRLAQLHLIRERIVIEDEHGKAHSFDASDPYFWAAFEVFGDWQ